MAEIFVSPAAETDAFQLWEHIARYDPAAAERVLRKLDENFRKLGQNPYLGVAVEHLFPRLRFIPEGNFLIFYRPIPDGIEVVRVLHGSRNIGAEDFEGR